MSISLNFTPKDERRNLQIKRQRYFNFFSFHTDAVVHLGYMDKWRFPANYFANFFNENDCTVWNNLTLWCFLKKMTGVAVISGYQDDCVIFSIVWCKWKKRRVYCVRWRSHAFEARQFILFEHPYMYFCWRFLILTSVIMYS